MALMEEAQYEVKKDDRNFMAKEITKDRDVIEASIREEGKIIHTHNSWMEDIIMLMSFLFVFVIGRLKCLCANEEESIDKLSVGQKEEELVCSKSEHMREEPKDLLQVQC